MTAALLLLLQLRVAADPATLTVRNAQRAVAVPIVRTASGPLVRPDLFAPTVKVSVRRLPNGHYEVSLPGMSLDLVDQVPFARIGTDVVPLAAAPQVRGGHLFIPLQIVTELVPRFASGLLYDAARTELRVFVGPAAVAASRSPAGDTSPRRPVESRRGGAPSREAAVPKRSRRRIVIDAGHGGPDPGMSGPIGATKRIREKDVTLAVARRLAAELRERGVEVVMTRSTDTLIALADRGRIANEQGGDLFISVHVNAANMKWKAPAAARGFETYFLAEAKTDEARHVEQMENEAVRFETGPNAARSEAISFVISDMLRNEYLRESSDLAATIQRRLSEAHPGPNRGVRQANFAVLRTSNMPAVLVEIGFGTNPEEAAFLASPARQQRMAEAIAAAAVEYLSRYERRTARPSS